MVNTYAQLVSLIEMSSGETYSAVPTKEFDRATIQNQS